MVLIVQGQRMTILGLYFKEEAIIITNEKEVACVVTGHDQQCIGVGL